MWRWVSLLLMSLGTLHAAELRTQVSKERITTAGRTELALIVVAALDEAVNFPDANSLSFGELTLVKYHTLPRKLVPGNQLQYEVRYLLEPFLAGNYETPIIPVTVSNDAGEQQTINSAPQTITVTSVLGAKPDDAELMDIVEHPFVTATVNWPGWLLAYVIISALILTILLRTREVTA